MYLHELLSARDPFLSSETEGVHNAFFGRIPRTAWEPSLSGLRGHYMYLALCQCGGSARCYRAMFRVLRDRLGGLVPLCGDLRLLSRTFAFFRAVVHVFIKQQLRAKESGWVLEYAVHDDRTS